jgi:epoxide hydrolase-like predicted phosphatase
MAVRPAARQLEGAMRQDARVTEIEAVLFDFGGVFTVSPFVALREAAAGFGVAPEVVLATVFGDYHQDTDHPWHRLERGEVTVQQAMAGIGELAAKSGYDIDPIAVLSSGVSDKDGEVVRRDVVAMVREIKTRGLKTAIVTNNIKEISAKWRALLPLDELFDLVVDSSEEGIRKPDERIFRLALDRLGGIAPERAVFLDDAPGNVAAARALGMHAIYVGLDHLSALDELRALVLS